MGCCCNEGDNEDGNKEQKEYDPSKRGPIANRSCTDVLCCLIFVIMFLGMIAIGAWAYSQGDPTRLLYPTDSEGNVCGVGDFEKKPFLFFFDLLDCAKVGPAALIATGCPTPQVCVEKCPSSTFIYLQAPEKMICKNGVDPKAVDIKSLTNLVENDECAAYYVKSNATLGRCLPSFINDILDETGDFLKGANNTVLTDKLGQAVNKTGFDEGMKAVAFILNLADYGTKILSDVRASWWMILVALAVSMVLAFVWIVLMRWLAGPVVWFTLIAFPALFAFGTYYCFNKYVQLKDDPSAQGGFKFTVELSYWTNLKDTWLALGIITVVFLAIVLLLIIFLAKRICLAIAIIAEASRALGSMIFTLFWPFVPFVLQVVLFAYWGASALFLASLSKGKFGNGTSTSILKPNESQQFTNVVDELTNLIPCDPSENGTAGSVCRFVKFGGDEYTVYLQFYMLFMLLWSANFIVALGQMTIAGAFASYFWAFNKPKDIPTFPVASSLGRALRYHLGTIAFGSLLVAIVQFIRIILEYLDHKLKASEYKIAKYLLKCLKCCFWCLEKFLKFFNTNAYIMTAIYGYNFCKAGSKAFSLILRNIIRVAVLDKVTDFLLFVGKLVVVGAVVVVSYFYFSGAWDEHIQKIPLIKELVLPDLNFYLIPIIIIGIGSFVIASGFFNVYSMGVDTLFLCFLEDLERHDGSAEKPYFMTKNLMKLLNKKNKKRKKDDE